MSKKRVPSYNVYIYAPKDKTVPRVLVATFYTEPYGHSAYSLARDWGEDRVAFAGGYLAYRLEKGKQSHPPAQAEARGVTP